MGGGTVSMVVQSIACSSSRLRLYTCSTLGILASCYVPDSENLAVLKLTRYPATTAELRRAYRRQALRWHPDKHRSDKPSQLRAKLRFMQVRQAFDALKHKCGTNQNASPTPPSHPRS